MSRYLSVRRCLSVSVLSVLDCLRPSVRKCICVCVYVCTYVAYVWTVCLSACLPACLSHCLSVSLSVCLSLPACRIPAAWSARLSACLPACVHPARILLHVGSCRLCGFIWQRSTYFHRHGSDSYEDRHSSTRAFEHEANDEQGGSEQGWGLIRINGRHRMRPSGFFSEPTA